MEKTLTKMMPQHPVPTSLVRLHHDRTTSEWETTNQSQLRRNRVLKLNLHHRNHQPEQIPMPELHSEDEDDPLDEDKFWAEEQAHAASLQRLVPLANTPESELESQAGTIADTPDAESEPAGAHELTGEGTTNADATDPTTSDGLTEGNEGDYAINWEELEAMYRGTSTCWDDCRTGILLPTTPELHPVPSPPDAILDEPGADTGTVPDAPPASPPEAMLDEPEADAGTAPDASPAMELRLLQSSGVPEQEPATLRSDTPPSKQAEHSPQQAESLPPPADALLTGPTYSSSETPPLPGPGTGYSSTSLSEEADEGNNTAEKDDPTEVDNTATEANSTGVMVNPELNIGTSPMETE